MARAGLRLGVRALAEAAKVSTNTITRLERGEVMHERTLYACEPLWNERELRLSRRARVVRTGARVCVSAQDDAQEAEVDGPCAECLTKVAREGLSRAPRGLGWTGLSLAPSGL